MINLYLNIKYFTIILPSSSYWEIKQLNFGFNEIILCHLGRETFCHPSIHTIHLVKNVRKSEERRLKFNFIYSYQIQQ